MVGVTARAYLLRESARDAVRAAAPAPAETTSPPPPGPPAAPASPPPGDPARPIVPAALRFAPPGWPQEIEQGYLELLRVRGEALLSLDPSALGAVAAGPALVALTAEVEGRRQDRQDCARPAWPCTRTSWCSTATSATPPPCWPPPGTTAPRSTPGRARPSPARSPRSWCARRSPSSALDGVWKAVGQEREVIAFLRRGRVGRGCAGPRAAGPPARPPGRRPHRGLPEPRRRGASRRCWPATALEAEVGVPGRAAGGHRRAAPGAQPALVARVHIIPTGALLLDEVYLDSSVWLDRRTRRPLPLLGPHLPAPAPRVRAGRRGPGSASGGPSGTWGSPSEPRSCLQPLGRQLDRYGRMAARCRAAASGTSSPGRRVWCTVT